MKRVLLFAAMAVSLPAQWLHYPTPGAPRTPDGAPDLRAPAPRTPDGHPDFTGMWDIEHNRPCSPCDDMMIGQEFMDIGWSLKGGLPYQSWAAQLRKERMAENDKGDPGSHCRPVGPVKMLTTPLFRKFIQTPGMLIILSEVNAAYRQIFLDGRPLPEDPEPAANGYSTAHWDGDTLVVETNGLRDGTWLDRTGSPMTAAAHLTERYRRLDYGHLQIDLTVNDPKAYTAPWTVRLNQFLKPDTEMLDYYCLDNEKDGPHLVGK